jgi:hypothetical protein
MNRRATNCGTIGDSGIRKACIKHFQQGRGDGEQDLKAVDLNIRAAETDRGDAIRNLSI